MFFFGQFVSSSLQDDERDVETLGRYVLTL